jgi:hypothetical protein
MQAYENKILHLHMLNKTIDDEAVCVCVLQILIMKDKILPFSHKMCEYTVAYKNSWHTCNVVVTHLCATTHQLWYTSLL